jgi:hypothetical protein
MHMYVYIQNTYNTLCQTIASDYDGMGMEGEGYMTAARAYVYLTTYYHRSTVVRVVYYQIMYVSRLIM